MIVLVRHGQTEANASGLLLGRSDPPLTDEGMRQAKALASVTGGAGRAVSSPLLRATQTAVLLGEGLPVEVDERWTEIDYGDYEGERLGAVPAQVWQHWRSDPDWTPPGGESLGAVGVRVRQACSELASEASRSDVVVVSHVSPIKAAVAWALGVDDSVAWRMHLGLASVCRIGIGERGPVLETFNETAHLDGC